MVVTISPTEIKVMASRLNKAMRKCFRCEISVAIAENSMVAKMIWKDIARWWVLGVLALRGSSSKSRLQVKREFHPFFLGRNQVAQSVPFTHRRERKVSISDLQDRRRCFGFPAVEGQNQGMRDEFSVSDVQDPCFRLNYPLNCASWWRYQIYGVKGHCIGLYYTHSLVGGHKYHFSFFRAMF